MFKNEYEMYEYISKWMEETQGYGFQKDPDGFWFEEYLTEHKWKDVFELMQKYAEYVVSKLGV